MVKIEGGAGKRAFTFSHRDAVSRLGAATVLREEKLGLNWCVPFRVTHGEVKNEVEP